MAQYIKTDNCYKKIPLHWQILIAIVFGCAYGYVFPDQVGYVSWMGDMFIQLLKMVVIPLIFCSLVAAITGIRGNKMGRLAGKTIGLYFFTTLLAVLIGLLLVNLIRPGAGINISDEAGMASQSVQPRTLSETLWSIVPENIFAALADGNMLPIVIFAVFFGIFLAKTRWDMDEGTHSLSVETLIRCFEGGFEVMMKMTVFILMFAPLGVFGIIAKNIALFGGESGAFAQLGQGLGLHVLTVFSALAIHMVVILSLCLWLLGGCNPWKHLSNMSAVILTAFSTASSNGTLPLTLRDTTEKSGVSPGVARFVLPLGATVNMNGTALYECAVVLFVAQAYGIELTLYQQFITVLMVLLTTLGVAGVPMASLVMIVIVLSVIGLPPEGIGLVIAVDRPLDMCRTVVNVYGDTCCAVIIAQSEGETLAI